MQSDAERKQLAVPFVEKDESVQPQPRTSSRRARALAILTTAAVIPLIGVWSLAIRQRQRYYLKLSSYCFGGCFVECWVKISGGKPVDSDSPLFKEIFGSMYYFFRKASYTRGGEFNPYERVILRYRHSEWVVRDVVRPDARRAYRFVLKHRLAGIFKRYVNLYNYVGFTAAKEIESFEKRSGVSPSIEYWKKTVRFDRLPGQLSDKTKSRAVGAFLRKNVKQLKRDLAEKNYVKLDLSFSDISSFIALSGTLLLVLGYLRTYLLAAYFGFPFQEYFGTTDYLTTSINLTGQYLFGALLTAAFSFLYLSTLGAYSEQEFVTQRKSISGRLNSFSYHGLGISSYAALASVYYNTRMVEPTSLLIAFVYPASIILPRIARSFFIHPLKSYVLMWLIFSTLISTATGVVREINLLNSQPTKATARILKFGDVEFSEAEWQFVAFTSEYVIMRNRSSRAIMVRKRADLKTIESAQSHS
jgi:hypothetical protein